jgi:DNA modification methylase
VIDGWVGGVTYITVATRGPRRFFDLDAVRGEHERGEHHAKYPQAQYAVSGKQGEGSRKILGSPNPAGAPPLDWHIDNPDTTIAIGADPMPIEYRIGDVRDRLAEIPDASIDLIVTSPPFLALRSYLPSDHPDKGREIGSEATPAAFLDTLLALSAEWGRVLAPHGSICVELGDTYAASPNQRKADNDGALDKSRWLRGERDGGVARHACGAGPGWPLAKSLTGIPTLYPWSLAYGRNLLTGQPSPAGRWRIRNVIVWARPNPPVGALGDKFRPATSYITVACRSPKRFFDLDAVRTASDLAVTNGGNMDDRNQREDDWRRGHKPESGGVVNPAGAPPLDWHQDEDGDWLWKLSTQPYRGAHYATFPLELPTRLIMAMCPLRVCVECGRPSERLTEHEPSPHDEADRSVFRALNANGRPPGSRSSRDASTVGWSDCGHNQWRTGVTLDPFAGSGTTLQAAQNVGRHAIGIDLDPRNAHLAQSRCGMFLEVTP